MSLPVSAVDIINISKAIIQLVQQAHQAPQEFSDLQRDLESVSTLLEWMTSQDLTDSELAEVEKWCSRCDGTVRGIAMFLKKHSAVVQADGLLRSYYCRLRWTFTGAKGLSQELKGHLQLFIAYTQQLQSERQ